MKIPSTGFRTSFSRSSLLLSLFIAGISLPIGVLTNYPGAVHGQTADKRPMPASAYKLVSVKATGSKRFTSDDIAAASGLPVGTVAHEEDFKKAARQLGESGAFASITFTYTYSSAGTKLEFQVTDAEKFVPARFTDFVWFTEAELLRRVHKSIPLYNGELPASGRLPDQVSDVLQALLVQNAIPGIVEYVRNNGKSGKLESFDYNVAGVSIRIHQLKFPGAGSGELPLLEAAGEKVIGREYSRAYMDSLIERQILPVYHEHGFLKASCATPEPTVVKPQSEELDRKGQPPTFVDVTFPLTPGVQYRLAAIEWSGNNILAKEALQPLLHAKTGEPANTVQLGDDLRAAQELYGSKGYVLATVKVIAEFDDAAGTVTLHLAVNEDSQFRMGELDFRGIDNNLTARLRAAWKIRPGDVYDAGYLQQFLPVARKLLPANLDWEVTTHVTAVALQKTVDVELQYTAKAPQ